jgi:crossover junction endodeoxyribonuclease RuvC
MANLPPAPVRIPPVRILGIDPGLRRTGWGVIESHGSRLSFVAAGVILSDEKQPLAQRLQQIHDGIAAALVAWSPAESAIEETFVSKDAKATLKLGHARGVAMLACAQAGLSVAEYAPNQVKKTVVGAGHAEKGQVQMMIKVLLPKAEFPNADAADALAVAICHAQHRGLKARL